MDSIIDNVLNSQEAQNEPTSSKQDRELLEILKEQQARIKVVGVGGAGGNTVSRISEVGVKGARIIAINTDAQDLLESKAEDKLLIGKELTRGLGAGAKPEVGEKAAKESEGDLRNLLKDSDMVFVTCGFGGGTGTGALPVVSEIAKKNGALVVGVVTTPFFMEGSTRYNNAVRGIKKLEKHVDTLIVIPNEKLLEIAPNLPLQTAFKLADEVLTNAVKGITELVTVNGLVNLDFADVKNIMSEAGLSVIGLGESNTENKAEECVEKALHNPLLDVDLNDATGALINVVGGNDLTLEEARQVVTKISTHLSDDAKIIWGAQIMPDLNKTIKTMVVVTGVKSEQILSKKRIDDLHDAEYDDDLGIEML